MRYLLLALAAVLLPVAAPAADNPHQAGLDQDCAECHEEQQRAWLGGAHGLMGVKCVVCHGAPEVNFTTEPGPARCQGCHGDAVDDVYGKLPAAEQSCFSCHEHHTAAVKASARSGFHGKGGAR